MGDEHTVCLARNASPAGSSAAAVSANTRRKVSPPRKSHTQAATTPPGRVTRPISRRPATGAVMK